MKKIILSIFAFFLLINPAFATDYCTGDGVCYLVNEGAGTVLNDSSGNFQTGNFKSSLHPSWNFSGLPTAYTTASTISTAGTDFVNGGTGSSINNLAQISISIWAKCTGTAGVNFLISKNVSGYPNGWSLYFDIQSSTTAFLHFDRGFSSNAGGWRTLATFNHTTWHHYVITYDDTSTSNAPIIYIDGSPQTLFLSSTPAGTPTDDSAGSLYLGEDQSSTFNYNGEMSQMAILNRILSSTEVIDIFSNGLKPSVPPPVFIYYSIGANVSDNAKTVMQ